MGALLVDRKDTVPGVVLLALALYLASFVVAFFGVALAAAADRAVQIAETYAPGKVVNLLGLGSSQQVMLEVRFAEVKRSALSQIGVSWGAMSPGGRFQGVIGGNAFVTEPSMAAAVGSIVFVVVVVGGMGSLAGAFIASLLIGVLQTFAVALDYSLMSVFNALGAGIGESTPGFAVLKVTIAQSAAILPFLLLVLMLIFRPKGLLGTRE